MLQFRPHKSPCAKFMTKNGEVLSYEWGTNRAYGHNGLLGDSGACVCNLRGVNKVHTQGEFVQHGAPSHMLHNGKHMA
jgi:hypothetical protein